MTNESLVAYSDADFHTLTDGTYEFIPNGPISTDKCSNSNSSHEAFALVLG